MAKDLKRRIVAEFSAKNRAKGVMSGFRRDMDTTGRAMKRMAMGALAMVGLGGGIYAVKRGFDAVTKAAMTQERAERDLMAATQGSIAQYKLYAAQMQALTVYGDEQILTQMAYAKNLGVTSEQLEKATTAAIGLAARYRIDLAAAMMLVGRASQGQTQMLTRYGIIVDQNLSAQDKFSEVLKIGAQSFRLATEETKTAEGALAQLKNTYGDILEIIGEPMIQAMAKNARATKDWLESVRPSFKRYIDDMAEGLEMMNWLNLKMLDVWTKYSPLGLAYQKFKEPEPKPIAKPAARFEDPTKRWIAGWQKLDEEAEFYRQLSEGTHASVMTQITEEWNEREKRTQEYGRVFEAEMEAASTYWDEQIEKAKAAEARAVEFAMTFRDVIANGFEQSMRDAKNWEEHMINMFENVYWAAVRMAFLDPMAGVLAKGMTKGLEWLVGPGIFATPAPTTPTVFTSPHGGPVAGLQHGGEVLKTGLAKVHKGEKYSGVGGGKLEVNVTYKGDERPLVEEAEFDFKQQVLNITMQAAATDGAFRRSIKQATR